MRVPDRVGAEHPALAGHFPGNPIVPGVLMLARVLRAAETALGARVSAVREAKFHAPLRPDEGFDIELERANAEEVRFRVVRGETRIAAGTLMVRPGPAV